MIPSRLYIAGLCFGLLLCAEALAEEGRIAVGYEPYGMSPFPLQSAGYRLSYQPLANAEIEATYVAASTRLLMIDVTYKETGIRYKHFLTSAVHAGIGVVDRTFTMDYEVSLTDDTAVDLSESANAIAGNVFFGFETTFWNFLTIGSDFVTYSQAIQWQSRDNKFPDDADASEEDPRELPFVQKALGNNVHFLRTYIKVGW